MQFHPCFLSIILQTLTTVVYSQSDTSTLFNKIRQLDRKFSHNDTSYISKSTSTWVFGLKSSNWLDAYDLETSEATSISMQSDLYYNLGVSVGYKFLTLGYSVNLTNVFSKQTVGKKWDFGINYNRFGLDAYYLNNTGNTNINEYTEGGNQQEMHQPFDGITSTIYGLDITYFFNHSRYSNAAAYTNYATIQRKRAGSWIAGLTFSRQKLFLDFSKLSEEITSTELKTFENADLLYNNYCISIGYGYNHTFAKQWLFNITEIPSVGIKHQHIKSLSENSSDNLSIMNRVKIAIVYNANHIYGGFNCFFTTNINATESYTLSNSIGVFNVFAGFRLSKKPSGDSKLSNSIN
jgi:hypothetical protein